MERKQQLFFGAVLASLTYVGLCHAGPVDCDQSGSAAPKAQQTVVTSPADQETVTENVELFPLILVELYTSQGCSSCPRADEFLATLADDPSILALSFNVSYWDYLGWKDRFSATEFTKRQKTYAEYLDINSVYTCLLYTSPSPRDQRGSRMPSSA